MMEIALSRSWPPPSHDMPYSTLNVMGAWPSWAAEILGSACMGQSPTHSFGPTVNPDYTPRDCRFTVSRSPVPLVVSSALYRCVPCRIFLRWRVLEWGIASRSTGLTMCEQRSAVGSVWSRVWVVLRGFVYLPPLDQGQILCRLTLSLQFLQNLLPHRRGIVREEQRTRGGGLAGRSSQSHVALVERGL